MLIFSTVLSGRAEFEGISVQIHHVLLVQIQIRALKRKACKRKKERKFIAPMRITKFVKLLVVLNKCDHIRKLLTRIIWARYLESC